MKAIKCNKAYLGTKEVTQGSISAGDSSIGLLYTSIFRKLGDYQTGDAVVWDTWKELFKVTPPENINQLDTERYIPTGVIAIPSSHDVYGTGEAGVMALLSASLTTPDTGQTSETLMVWGGFGTNYPELNDYKVVPAVAVSYRVDNIITSAPSSSWLPSDAFGSQYGAIAIDETFYYRGMGPSSSRNNYIPSPYLKNGSRNPAYYQTEPPSSSANVLSDFAGKSNTEFLCSKATAQTDWRTATTITNNHIAGYHPAACACWRYHTTGTVQGDWYLPACGELGYACVRKKRINETIEALQSHFGITLCQLSDDGYGYHSSSERDQQNSWHVEFGSGGVSAYTRGYPERIVRPFTRLK